MGGRCRGRGEAPAAPALGVIEGADVGEEAEGEVYMHDEGIASDVEVASLGEQVGPLDVAETSDTQSWILCFCVASSVA